MQHQSPPDNLPRAQRLAERAFTTVQRFLHVEAASGVVLLIAAAIGLLWANSPFLESYHALWHLPLSIGLGGFTISKPLDFWVNDALMTVFFLVIGMETGKRQEVVIVGFTAPRRSRPYFGALVLAVRDKDDWRYVGRVGTGFSHATLNGHCARHRRGSGSA
jgi:Na+/H+ antiporter 1/ATP dependent DNA ligase C terminal region